MAGLILDYTRAYRTEVTLRITEEKLRVARDVHERLLPSKPPQIAGYDMAGYSIAADSLGGDYFDYVAMKDGCLGVVVADVSGHDIGAAMVMAHTRAYLRALAQTKDELSSMMSELNALLDQDVQGRWFVTMFFVRLEPETGAFEYSGNGHESYLFDDEGVVTTLENTSPPLGILERETIFTCSEMQLKIGDILLLLTDGFAEAKSPDGEYFGLERVFAEVRKHRKESAKQIADTLYQAVTAFRKGAPVEDDVTVVVLKRNGTG